MGNECTLDGIKKGLGRRDGRLQKNIAMFTAWVEMNDEGYH
jgi:hypothetical protein